MFISVTAEPSSKLVFPLFLVFKGTYVPGVV